MLKTLDRFVRNIRLRNIKRVFVLDDIFHFKKIRSVLEDTDIEIITIPLETNKHYVYKFTTEDCLIVTDLTIHNFNSNISDLLIQAKEECGQISVLTEDIWSY